jgi:hypothetical protein
VGIVQRKATLPTGWQSVKLTGVGPQRKTYSVSR